MIQACRPCQILSYVLDFISSRTHVCPSNEALAHHYYVWHSLQGNVNNWLFVRKPEDEMVHQQQEHQHQQHPSSQVTPPPTTPPAAATLEDPSVTKRKIKDFLSSHTATELVPESGKVVLLDMDLPLRQALHALHEQGTVFAPLFDTDNGSVRGVICASDFIPTLQQLSSSNPMSEAEMDQHTIRLLLYEEEDISLDYVEPEDVLQHVVDILLNNHRSMVPIAIVRNRKIQEVLHNASLGGVLSCLLRHFRASFSLMPLLAKPLDELGIGTWSNIATVGTSTLLTEALSMLKTYSCLPVIDDDGMLVDIYTRTDIISLAKSNAYSRLQFEDVTVGQALSLTNMNASGLPSVLGSTNQYGGMSPNISPHGSQADIMSSPPKNARIQACVSSDPLKSICRRMCTGTARLLVVDPESKKLLGIVTISDVCRFLFSGE